MMCRRRRGRPRIASGRYQVRLPPKIAKTLREYGDGSISRGVIKLHWFLANAKP
jgi:hypothetical protein